MASALANRRKQAARYVLLRPAGGKNEAAFDDRSDLWRTARTEAPPVDGLKLRLLRPEADHYIRADLGGCRDKLALTHRVSAGR